MPKGFLTHVNAPTRARVVLAAAGRRRDRLTEPAAEESPTRARRPSRRVDLLTVLTGRAVTPGNASADPRTSDLYRVAPTELPMTG